MSTPPDQAETRSVHGGRLPVDEQLIRSEAFSSIFGTSARRCIGRFEVLRTLGAGGMGCVFAAHDATLDRTVAVKVVRNAGGGDPEVLRRRMEREAKALAQLGHPHVVSVYEVGTHEDGIFIAMEYVDGPNLRAWQAEEDRSQADILRVYAAAGRGLAAAHRRGIIHRDFKPDNVLVDREEGRARVADFGLATGAGNAGNSGGPPPARSATLSSPQSGSGETVGASSGITSEGVRVGTPAYMSPEQRRGEPLTAASDQYSFCVALAEALVGERPTCAHDLTAVRTLPRRVHAALQRGLDAEPELRWPDFDALLAKLEPPASRRVWAAGAALVACSAGVVVASTRPHACDRPEMLSWAHTRTELRDRLLRAEPAYVPATWPVVSAELERHAQGWHSAVDEACAAAQAQTDSQQAEVMHCLGRRRARFEAVVGGLHDDTDVWGPVAVAMVSALSEASTCHARTGRGHASPPTDAAIVELDATLLAAQLAFARARSGAGQDVAELRAQAHEHARRVSADAERIGDAQAQGEGLRLLGQLALHAGEVAVAAEHFAGAAAAAERAGDVRGRARSLSLQGYAVGQDRARLDEASRLVEQALAALEGAGDDPWVRAHILNTRGAIAARARPPKLAQAVREHRRAIELFTDVVGPRHPETLQARLNLGAALNRAGETALALRELDEAVTEVAEVWGERHPTSAKAQRIRGLARLRAGQAEAAAGDIRRSLQIHTAAFGGSHPEVASDLYNLALTLRKTQAYGPAAEALTRGLHIREAQLGTEHPELIPWLLLVGRTHAALGELSLAVPAFERALTLCELDGALPFEFARLRLLLAEALQVRDPVRARLLARQALRFFDAGPGHKTRSARARAVLARPATAESPPGSAEPVRSR